VTQYLTQLLWNRKTVNYEVKIRVPQVNSIAVKTINSLNIIYVKFILNYFYFMENKSFVQIFNVSQYQNTIEQPDLYINNNLILIISFLLWNNHSFLSIIVHINEIIYLFQNIYNQIICWSQILV